MRVQACFPYLIIVCVVMTLYSAFLLHLSKSFQHPETHTSAFQSIPYISLDFTHKSSWGTPPKTKESVNYGQPSALPCSCTPESQEGLEAGRDVVMRLSYPYRYFDSNHWFHISEYYVRYLQEYDCRHMLVAPKLPREAIVYIVAPHQLFVAKLIPMTFFLLLLAFTDGTARAAAVLPAEALLRTGMAPRATTADDVEVGIDDGRSWTENGQGQDGEEDGGGVWALDTSEVECWVYNSSLPAFKRARRYKPGERKLSSIHRGPTRFHSPGKQFEYYTLRGPESLRAETGFGFGFGEAAEEETLGSDGNRRLREGDWPKKCEAKGYIEHEEALERKAKGDEGVPRDMRLPEGGRKDRRLSERELGNVGVTKQLDPTGIIPAPMVAQGSDESTKKFSAAAAAAAAAARATRQAEADRADGMAVSESAVTDEDNSRESRILGENLADDGLYGGSQDARVTTGNGGNGGSRSCACAQYIGEFGPAPVERGYWFKDETVGSARERIDALCGNFYRLTEKGHRVNTGAEEWERHESEESSEDDVKAYPRRRRRRQRLVIYQRDADRRLLELDKIVNILQEQLGGNWRVVPIVHDNEHEPCWLYSQLMDADMLLTPHGFQSMLLLFLPPGATILEVFPYKYWKEGYAPLAEEWGVRHEHIMSRPVSWIKGLALFFVPLEHCMRSIDCRKWSRSSDVRLEDHHLIKIAQAAHKASRRKQGFLPPRPPDKADNIPSPRL